MSELLPCPNCGHAASTVSFHTDDAFEAFAGCHKNHDCPVTPFVKFTSGTREDAIAGATAAWNTRADGWQPIETAPKDGTQISGWDGQRITTMIWDDEPDDDEHTGWCCAGFSYGGILYELHNTMSAEPTHWMPLPTPPTTKD